MKIADIESGNGFVSPELVKRSIKWDGHDGEVFVRRVSFATIAATQSLPDAERSIALVRECVRLGDKGDEQLTRKQVESLAPALAAAFLTAIAEINKLGADADPLP